MGLMKILHTKKCEQSALSAAERKFVEHNEKRSAVVVPEYLETKIEGQPSKLILGFPDTAIAVLKKSGVLYFISWSVNFADYTKFHEVLGFYDLNKYKDAQEGRGLIPVTIDGPYDLAALTADYIPFSPYKSLEYVKDGLANWGQNNRINDRAYPLFLWRASKAN